MAITKKELIKLMKHLKINAKGRRYVFNIASRNGPSRRPTGHYLCVHETIASRKEGWTRDSEARSTELPLLLWCEFNSDVIAYYTQIDDITVSFIKSNGKRVTYKTKPDFLIITKDYIAIGECKKAEQLDRSIKEEPNKFKKTEFGYAFPGAESAVESMGLRYRVFTDRDFMPTFTRNCIYLLNFIDDLHTYSEEIGKHVLHAIERSGNRVRLNELFGAFGQLNIIRLLFAKIIFIDFNHELLCHPEWVWVYGDQRYRDAICRTIQQYDLFAASSLEQLVSQDALWWGAEQFEILLVNPAFGGGLKLRHSTRGIIELSTAEVNKLFSRQEIYIPVSGTPGKGTAESLLCSKKAWQIDEARVRLAQIENKSSAISVSERTIFRWKQRVKSQQDPLAAIVSDKDRRGRRESRLCADTLKLMSEFFEKLKVPSPPSIYSVWKKFYAACEEQKLEACSNKTFSKRFKALDKYSITLATKGFKAAYALGPQPREIDLDWDLPYHGDFIFEVAHVDHTPIEIVLISNLDGKVLEGTLNLSVMYDGHSRTILAVYISFEKPSYRATMMLLRECYRRYQRLPLFLATDHGPDFESEYYDITLADIGCHKRRRPKCASRHGTIIERVFGCTETELIHTLAGNKQLQKLGRGQSPTHRPELFANLTPDDFEAELKGYAYLLYPNQNRRGISEKPIERWNTSAAKFDELPGTKVRSEASFYLSTLPDAGGDGCRVLHRNQMEHRGFNYLLSTKVIGYSGERIRPRVKYDPYHPEYIYACVRGRWARLNTNDELVRECRDKGVRLAHMEVYSRHLRNSRRRAKGSQLSLELHNKTDRSEQHEFNMRQDPLGTSAPGDTAIPEPARPFDIDLTKVQQLPAIIKPRV